MAKPIELSISPYGAYVASVGGVLICSTWDRELAQSSLEYYMKSYKISGRNKTTGSWDKTNKKTSSL